MRSFKETWLGDYDYGFLCKPQWPFCRKTGRAPAKFFGTYDYLGVLLTLIMGLQHAMAMVGGLITPPLLVGNYSTDPTVRQYLIQTALIICGIMTFIQVTGFRFGNSGYRLGAGVLSVMGVSFATVPIATSVLGDLTGRQGLSFDRAFGKFIGTLMACSVIPIFFSLLPYKALRKIFPPIVSGVTIILIGANLAGTGIRYWGGGVFCSEHTEIGPASVANCVIPNPDGTTTVSDCYAARPVLCSNNGDVVKEYGSLEYWGMGLLVFCTIIFVELFGSPFMRNCNVALALFFGYFIAAVAKFDGKSMVTSENFDSAPIATFLWTTTFNIGFHPPAILPLVIVFCITSIESVGDISATAEASRLETSGPEQFSRIRGALLNDSFSSFISASAGSLPLTTFAQNNGVISLTAVASRWAGWGAAFWLVLLGILGKFGAFILSIPDCVLGGMTTFLFANVIASGIKIIISEESLTRRNRFILACSLGLGIGVSIVPQWALNNLWNETPEMSDGVRGIRQAIILILETGFCLGALMAFALNMLLPQEVKDTSIIDPSMRGGAEYVVDKPNTPYGAPVKDTGMQRENV